MKARVFWFLFFLFLWGTPGLVYSGDRIEVSDEQGDATFSKNPLPAFDLKSVTFSAYEGGHLLVTYTGYGPMSDLGEIYSWFAVWIDLDRDRSTGQSYGDLGADLILGTESTRGGPWTGEANVRAPVGDSEVIELLQSWTKDNQAFSLYKSPHFLKYANFRAAAFSHHDGEFVDTIEGGKMDSINIFERPGTLKPVPDFFDYRFEGTGKVRMFRFRRNLTIKAWI